MKRKIVTIMSVVAASVLISQSALAINCELNTVCKIPYKEGIGNVRVSKATGTNYTCTVKIDNNETDAQVWIKTPFAYKMTSPYKWIALLDIKSEKIISNIQGYYEEGYDKGAIQFVQENPRDITVMCTVQ